MVCVLDYHSNCDMDECPLYNDPELYDSLFPDAGDSASLQDESRRGRVLQSERFYLEEARKSGGRVLELACGSGRLTIPIARNGTEIIGADLSKSMLETARAKARRAGVEIQFLEADMRSFELAGKFAAILIPGNSLLHLFTAEDLMQCFRNVHRHLAPNGRLLFDISKWDIAMLARDPRERYPVLTVNGITIEETASYDSAQQIRRIVWYLSKPGAADHRVIDYSLRVIFPQELLLLLDAAGFRMETRYGEFTREPFQSSSPRQVCICSSVP
jgi:SAM-dependent methyltransferase